MATCRRRRCVRQLVLEAARARASDALTLATRDGDAKPLFAPYSPSPHATIDAVWTKLAALQVALSADDLLVDLGCGDGRWLISGAQRFGCSALGIELDLKLVQRAKEHVAQQRLQGRVRVELGDVLEADVSNATLVIVYAFADSVATVVSQLIEQLTEEANVLSIGFRVPEWKASWGDRDGGLPWYFYRMSDCVGKRGKG
ncbi:unnamed protein product [Hyaloperonospora brassicae]|uniref:Methyltransferase domain-containing protein n=1 Tax=Hyaloperonospora brassicae TaxID=162125 RepID=A0AAV0UQ36_HYABA|nr:unnamed protein product [Hyaloperonospora brassicae]